MASKSVIVFGASGKVASAVASTAKHEGAKVYMASRNPKKAVPDLGSGAPARFDAVYADLSKPDTVRDAITSTGAKRAFFYLLMTASDAMRGVIDAMKFAGIEFVVFLSSLAVRDKAAPDLENIIAVKHARVETILEEIFGQGHYAAVRPGYFATNTLRWKDMIAKGEVKIPFADVVFDWIDERDIGAVAGKLLAGNSQALETVPADRGLWINGAALLSQRAAAETISKTLEKDLKITSLTEEEGVQFFVIEGGIPKPMAVQLVKMLKERNDEVPDGHYKEPFFATGQAHLRRVTGKDPTTFAHWVEDHKADF